MPETRQELEDNIIAAAQELTADWSLETVDDIATALNCREADALAGLFRAVEALEGVGEYSMADTLIECHARGDEQGDSHFNQEEA